MELMIKKCTSCKSRNVSDTEKFTQAGWMLIAAAVVIGLVGFVAMPLWNMPMFGVAVFFVAAGGLVGYARNNQMYPSNRCRDCRAEGEFPLTKEFDEEPKPPGNTA